MGTMKWEKQQYLDILSQRKAQAHDKAWLYIDIMAKDLLEECEPGVKNLNTCAKAMLESMLEGDTFIVEPKNRSKCAKALTIRYYVDNLSAERRTYAQANK